MTYIMATVMLLIMVALGVFVVVTVSSVASPDRTRTGHRQASAASGPGALDAAEEELRMLYARGEIDREEFLQRKIDLER